VGGTNAAPPPPPPSRPHTSRTCRSGVGVAAATWTVSKYEAQYRFETSTAYVPMGKLRGVVSGVYPCTTWPSPRLRNVYEAPAGSAMISRVPVGGATCDAVVDSARGRTDDGLGVGTTTGRWWGCTVDATGWVAVVFAAAVFGAVVFAAVVSFA
jgi:hypothetical protein